MIKERVFRLFKILTSLTVKYRLTAIMATLIQLVYASPYLIFVDKMHIFVPSVHLCVVFKIGKIGRLTMKVIKSAKAKFKTKAVVDQCMVKPNLDSLDDLLKHL